MKCMATPMEAQQPATRKRCLGRRCFTTLTSAPNNKPENAREPRQAYEFKMRGDIERMRHGHEVQRNAPAIVWDFNSHRSAKRSADFGPTIAPPINARHPWLIIACHSCGVVIELNLRMGPRDPRRQSAPPDTASVARDPIEMGARASSRWRQSPPFSRSSPN